MWQAVRLVAFLLVTLVAVALARLGGRRGHADWSWRAELLARVCRWLSARVAGVPPARLRGRFPQAPVPRRLRRAVSLEPGELAGLEVERTTPSGWTAADGTILYLHGGGYVVCSIGTHRDLVARIAVASGARVISVEYRLAPEHPFPAAVDDAWRAYRALLAAGTEPARLALAGDSAGGGLCLAVAQRASQAGEPRPAALVLLSPWVDLRCEGESFEQNAPFDYLNRDLCRRFAAHYLAGASACDPWASPVQADFSRFPSMLVHTGGVEVLRAEQERLVARARAAGVSVEHDVVAGMMHAWHGFAGWLPEGRAAIERVGRYLRGAFGALGEARAARPASGRPTSSPCRPSAKSRSASGRPS